MNIGMHEEILPAHVFFDEFFVLGCIPSAEHNNAIACQKPAETVVPQFFNGIKSRFCSFSLTGLFSLP